MVAQIINVIINFFYVSQNPDNICIIQCHYHSFVRTEFNNFFHHKRALTIHKQQSHFILRTNIISTWNGCTVENVFNRTAKCLYFPNMAIFGTKKSAVEQKCSMQKYSFVMQLLFSCNFFNLLQKLWLLHSILSFPELNLHPVLIQTILIKERQSKKSFPM